MSTAEKSGRPERDQDLRCQSGLLEQDSDLREAHEKSFNEMEELKRFQGSTHSKLYRGETWSKIEILSLKSQARFRKNRTVNGTEPRHQ